MKKNKSIFEKLKKVKLSRIIILIFLLMFNAFAWFIYATEVSSGVNARVKSWKVVFKEGENEIINHITINIDSLYPGMENFEKTISVYNQSETSASITFEITKARIIDQDYITVEGYKTLEQTPPDGTLTSEQLATSLREDYPFKIDILTTPTILGENGENDYTIKASWAYESGDDEADTFWGEKAYDYNSQNPTKPSIELEIQIKATQT